MVKIPGKKSRKLASPEYGLSLNEIPCLCHIGILPMERVQEQPLFVNAHLLGDFHKVASTGDLSRGVDYSVLQHDFQEILKVARFYLIETAALALCQWTLWRFKCTSQVQISITKPHALMGQGIPVVSCRLIQKKQKLSSIIRTPEFELYEKPPRKKNPVPSDTHKLTLVDGRHVYALFFHKSP